jgi:hypothetical protein
MSARDGGLIGTKRKRTESGDSSILKQVQGIFGEDSKGPFAELFPLTHEERKSGFGGEDVGELFADPITLSCLFGPDLSETTLPVVAPPPRAVVPPTSGGEKKMHVCPVPSCNKEFRDRSGLRKHKKAKHSFNCPHDTCGKVFPTLEALLAHMSDHANA